MENILAADSKYNLYITIIFAKTHELARAEEGDG
jgi:hypothetical protein